jgi:arginase family enzyme
MSSDRWPREALDPYVKVLTPIFYGGTPTVFGAPYASGPDELQGHDVAFLGIPWQSPAAPGRENSIVYAGTMMAPLRFRYNSIKYGGYIPELSIHVFEQLNVCDYGNADVVLDVEETMRRVRSKVAEIVAAGCIPITLGGNGPCAANPVLHAIAEASSGPVAVVNFDAHHDNVVLSQDELANPRSAPWGEGWANMIFDLPNVSARHFQHVGLRGPRNDRDAMGRFVDRGVPESQIYTYRELKAARRSGFDEWAEQIAERTSGASKVWIAIDPDVLDMAVAPHGEPLGLHVEELLEVVLRIGRATGRERFGGFSVMAVPPDMISVHWISVYAMLYALAGVLGAGGDQ